MRSSRGGRPSSRARSSSRSSGASVARRRLAHARTRSSRAKSSGPSAAVMTRPNRSPSRWISSRSGAVLSLLSSVMLGRIRDMAHGTRESRGDKEVEAHTLRLGCTHEVTVQPPGHAHVESAAVVVVILVTRLRHRASIFQGDLKPQALRIPYHLNGLFWGLSLAHAPW